MTIPNDKCVILTPVGLGIESETKAKIEVLRGRGYRVLQLSGAAVDFARSHMATMALSAGMEELFWIDSDIDFDVEDVERLRADDLNIVCGLYRKKNRPEFACKLRRGTKEVVVGEAGGLYHLHMTGFGFVCTRATVYHQMREKCELPLCYFDGGRTVVPYFIPAIGKDEKGRHWYQNEDYAWCERAKECGFGIVADTKVKLWHIDHESKYRFSWDDMLAPGTPKAASIVFPVED